MTLLLVYIGLGIMAFKKAKTTNNKLSFLVSALLVYMFIISVAIAKSPLGVFA
jgi:uncharacterized membrane protein SirB2